MFTRINPMSEDKVKAVLKRFAEMRESEPPKAAPSFKTQIEGMAAEIRELVRKGYGYADVAAAIYEAGGVSMSVGTLKNYVSRATCKKKGSRRNSEPKKALQ